MSSLVQPAPDALARRLREEFPLLARQVHGRPLVYLDNGATAQKPRAVLAAMERYYAEDNANVHRGVHYLSQAATDAYEAARDKVQRFLRAARREEVIFTRGATEAINVVAHGLARAGHFAPGDEIVLSVMEHHANIVSWQVHTAGLGVRLVPVPVSSAGELAVEDFARAIGPRTKLVAVVHVSNTLGTINPVAEIAALARARGVPILIDGAQAVAHLAVDVQALGADFYTFSGHKLFGPTGIGVLYLRDPWGARLPAFQGGGDMIETVAFEGTTFQGAPNKFEAGTPNIAGAVGLGAAVDWVGRLGYGALQAYEEQVTAHALRRLGEVEGVTLVGTARQRVPVFSFTVAGAHPHDVGTILDARGIAVRAGHHCTQPLMRHLGLPGTTRASLAPYNTFAEVDALAAALPEVVALFR